MISKRVLSSISYPYLSRLTKALLILQVDPEPNVHKPLVGFTGFRPCGSGFRVFKKRKWRRWTPLGPTSFGRCCVPGLWPWIFELRFQFLGFKIPLRFWPLGFRVKGVAVACWGSWFGLLIWFLLQVPKNSTAPS